MTQVIEFNSAKVLPTDFWLLQPAGLGDTACLLSNALGPEWVVERVSDCEGDLSIMVFSSRDPDAMPTFVLLSKTTGFALEPLNKTNGNPIEASGACDVRSIHWSPERRPHRYKIIRCRVSDDHRGGTDFAGDRGFRMPAKKNVKAMVLVNRCRARQGSIIDGATIKPPITAMVTSTERGGRAFCSALTAQIVGCANIRWRRKLRCRCCDQTERLGWSGAAVPPRRAVSV